jgi:hypothetical protein
MEKPVVCSEGFMFESQYIEQWLRQSSVHPITRRHMTMADLKPNRTLDEACRYAANISGRSPGWSRIDTELDILNNNLNHVNHVNYENHAWVVWFLRVVCVCGVLLVAFMVATKPN